MAVQISRAAVQRLMGERNLTSNALASKMGISPQALSAALGRETFSPPNVAKMAAALGVEYEDVLRKEDPE